MILYVEWQKNYPKRKQWGAMRVIQILSHKRTVENAVKDAIEVFKANFKSGMYNLSIHINETANKTRLIRKDNVTLTGTGFARIIEF